MPLKQADKLLKKAIEEEKRELALRFYLSKYPFMTEKDFISFDDYYDQINPQPIEYDTRNKDEIMNEILGIKNS